MPPSHPAANGFQPAKRLPYVDHFCGRYCVDLEAISPTRARLSLAPPSLRLPSLSLALPLFSPVTFACDSQRLSVNV